MIPYCGKLVGPPFIIYLSQVIGPGPPRVVLKNTGRTLEGIQGEGWRYTGRRLEVYREKVGGIEGDGWRDIGRRLEGYREKV